MARVYIVEQEFEFEPGRIVAVYGNEAEATARSLNEAVRVADDDEAKVTWNDNRRSHEVRVDGELLVGFRVQGFSVM